LNQRLLLLDRDGVINEMVADPEHGVINSPLHPDQVVLRPGVGKSLVALREMGFVPVIVTNQPAAAKGTTTLANLEATHARVLELLGQDGAKVEKSYICFHRSEDDCACRKPKTGLLENAGNDFPYPKADAWMVGDGVTDIQAGTRFGVKTVYVGAKKTDAVNLMDAKGVRPHLWVSGLPELVSVFKGEKPMDEFSSVFLEETIGAIRGMDKAQIEAMAEGLAGVRKAGGRLFILGVGGSAGHASHAVNDFRKICGFEAYCPTDNVSELTARINDDGWETCFSGWLEGSRLNENDGLLIFSVGGGNREKNVSTSLVRALELAMDRKSKVFGIVGKDGGFTKQVANACLVVPTISEKRITPHTEGLCAVVWHLLVSHPALQMKETKWESVAKKS
jgi:D-sedoheptulose 7-phosphate isomerase